MSRRVNKSQQRKKKQLKQQKKQQRIESMDKRGLSREKVSFTMLPKHYFILKISLLVAIPLSYFLYSPLLLILLVAYILTFIAARYTERGLNRSVIKANHITIPKYDVVLAAVLVVIGFFGSFFQIGRIFSRPIGNRWFRDVWMRVKEVFGQFGSLMTGTRSVFGRRRGFAFGTAERPDNFVPNDSAFMSEFGDMPQGPGGRPDFEPSLDSLPLEFLFSNILSTIVTAMIFTVVGLGIVSLYQTYVRLKHFNEGNEEVIVESKLAILDDDSIEKIVDFGEVEEEH